jgi:hypothetical protein
MSTNDQSPADKSAERRRKRLTDEQIRELELAGGVEGGMQAGSAGGPGEKDAHRDDQKPGDGDKD